MILSDTLNQPRALIIYAFFGIMLGLLYTFNALICSFLIKKQIYRHISQCLYVLLYGATFFLVTYAQFDYDLKIYHLIICVFFTVLTSLALYLPIKKHQSAIMAKCNAFKIKIAQSKLIKKFKK